MAVEPARDRRRRARPAHRQDVRAHRHAGDDVARGRDGGDRAAGRKGGRARSARRRATWSSAPNPGASSRRRAHSASRRSMRPRFGRLIIESMSRRFALVTVCLTAIVGLSRRAHRRRVARARVGAVQPLRPRPQPLDAARASPSPPGAAVPGTVNFADIAERLNPAVVNIDATRSDDLALPDGQPSVARRQGSRRLETDPHGEGPDVPRRGHGQRVRDRPDGLHPHEPPRDRAGRAPHGEACRRPQPARARSSARIRTPTSR